MADQKLYDQGTRPKILINWNSFTQRGIPNEWQETFHDLVINAYTRCMHMAGVDLRFQFWNYTDKTTSDDGELIIQMDDRFGGGKESRLASTLGSYNKLTIIFHRQNAVDLKNWNFVPHIANNDGELDFYTILLHELCHCMGLDHTPNINDVMFPNYAFFQRYGLYKNDVERSKLVYNDFSRNRIRQIISTNGGASWFPLNCDLTSINSLDARTNTTLGVSSIPNTGNYFVTYDGLDRKPSRAIGAGNIFLNNWSVFGGENSIYGSSIANDGIGNIIYTWVDNTDSGAIKIVRSTDGGNSWFWTSAPQESTTYGIPALCFTKVNGVITLIMVWSYFNRNNRTDSGFIKSSISTDYGTTWSIPVIIDKFYKVLSGISIACDDNNNIVLGFSWSPNSLITIYGTNQIRNFKCKVEDNQLKKKSIIYTNLTTRIQPAIAFDTTTQSFVMVYRGQNFNTSLNVVSMNLNANGWSQNVELETRSNVAPCITYSKNRRELVIWYAFE